MVFRVTTNKNNKVKIKDFTSLEKCRKYTKQNKKVKDITIEIFIHPTHSITCYKKEDGTFGNDYNYPLYF